MSSTNKSKPLTNGTDSRSLNSTYAMPLNLRVLLHTISLASLTLPTLDMKSSRSLARHLALSCMQNTVRASRSSGVSGASGLELRTFLMWNSVLTLPLFLMGEMGPLFRPGPTSPPRSPRSRLRFGGDPRRASTRLSRERSRVPRRL